MKYKNLAKECRKEQDRKISLGTASCLDDYTLDFFAQWLDEREDKKIDNPQEDDCKPLREDKERDGWMADGIRRYNKAKENGTLDKNFPVIFTPQPDIEELELKYEKSDIPIDYIHRDYIVAKLNELIKAHNEWKKEETKRFKEYMRLFTNKSI